ncbi:hypothetical protein [Flagellimonas okinawensis]|uniref:DUF2029 domain-containing protein n=1 Tax=Flagellimonas okinawensis TaxID=3031324 RepID=A0ABT5XQ76_9FLAO|nr:hypothetical protein [[Muricauda] okinawensis]MDF0707741.1 hypothetical protein [[Muricauda] okinawensis]
MYLLKNFMPKIGDGTNPFGKRSLKIFRLLLPYLISAGLSFLIFKVHMLVEVDSMLNEKNDVISNGFLTSQITYHKEFAPFARRPLTTLLVEQVSNGLGITLGKAFVWVNFFLLFLAGVLLFRFSREMGSGYVKGIMNIIFFFLSFSVLFAFFPPIFSYDEPLQYCLLFAGMTCFLRRQWMGYVLWFTAAMIARENTAFLIPGLLAFLPDLHPKGHRLYSSEHLLDYLLIGSPILIYAAFLVFFMEWNGLWIPTQMEFQDRLLSIKENFRDAQSSIETLISIVLTLGMFVYFIFGPIGHAPKKTEKKFVRAFVLSCSVNTVAVLVGALAREARLFSLPLIFLWPIMGQYCSMEISLLLSYKTYVACFSRLKYMALLGILTLLNYLVSFKVYQPSSHPADNYFNEYLFTALMIMYVHYLLRQYTRHDALEVTPTSFSL